MAKKQRDLVKESWWREIVERHVASGLTVRAFCLQEGLGESAFHFWRRTIRQRDEDAKRGSKPRTKSISSPRSTASSNAKPSPFMPVVMTDAPNRADRPNHDLTISMDLASGHVLRFSETTSPAMLADFIVALEGKRLEARSPITQPSITRGDR